LKVAIETDVAFQLSYYTMHSLRLILYRGLLFTHTTHQVLYYNSLGLDYPIATALVFTFSLMAHFRSSFWFQELYLCTPTAE